MIVESETNNKKQKKQLWVGTSSREGFALPRPPLDIHQRRNCAKTSCICAHPWDLLHGDGYQRPSSRDLFLEPDSRNLLLKPTQEEICQEYMSVLGPGRPQCRKTARKGAIEFIWLVIEISLRERVEFVETQTLPKVVKHRYENIDTYKTSSRTAVDRACCCVLHRWAYSGNPALVYGTQHVNPTNVRTSCLKQKLPKQKSSRRVRVRGFPKTSISKTIALASVSFRRWASADSRSIFSILAQPSL